MLRQKFQQDMFSLAKNNDVCCLPISRSIISGKAVMDYGVAKQATLLHKELPSIAGSLLSSGMNQGCRIATLDGIHYYMFPVKQNYKDEADVNIILSSAEYLCRWINKYSDKIGNIYLPAPGCGYGGLSYEIVQPILELTLNECKKDIFVMRGKPIK